MFYRVTSARGCGGSGGQAVTESMASERGRSATRVEPSADRVDVIVRLVLDPAIASMLPSSGRPVRLSQERSEVIAALLGASFTSET